VSQPRLRGNLRAYQAAMGEGVGLMAMVKAAAYGHGLVEAAGAFAEAGAAALGVALPGEALELRRAGLDLPILVVGWSHPQTHAAMVAADVALTVADTTSAPLVAAAARQAGRPADVHLKVDTGMNRQGVRPEDVPAVLGQITADRDHLRLRGLFTHFADADGRDPAFTEQQHRRFQPIAEAVHELHPEVLLHCCNSAAGLRFAHMRHDMVRPGIALYGYPPANCPALDVVPAMTVYATVSHLKTVRAGESVGYNCTWTAQRDTRVATVAAGYADGVHRAQSNRGVVLAGGVRCPILGTVSMDQVTVDVSEVEGLAVGDAVIMLGGSGAERLGADQVAAVEGTISYEVLCAVSARVPRRPVES
jgi:alanine racemase